MPSLLLPAIWSCTYVDQFTVCYLDAWWCGEDFLSNLLCWMHLAPASESCNFDLMMCRGNLVIQRMPRMNDLRKFQLDMPCLAKCTACSGAHAFFFRKCRKGENFFLLSNRSQTGTHFEVQSALTLRAGAGSNMQSCDSKGPGGICEFRQFHSKNTRAETLGPWGLKPWQI